MTPKMPKVWMTSFHGEVLKSLNNGFRTRIAGSASSPFRLMKVWKGYHRKWLTTFDGTGKIKHYTRLEEFSHRIFERGVCSK